MSEYQYLEFQTVGSHLGDEAMRQISSLSSRAEVSRSSASFTYHFGSFPANPIKILEKHFDAFLYLANWGTRRLAFRFPVNAVNRDALHPFDLKGAISVELTTAHVLVDMCLGEEEDLGWIEGEGALDDMIQVYDEILAGDYRALFLVWLQAALLEEEGRTKFSLPPIPPGLEELSDAHQALITFFEIDADLVAAAAAFSAPIRRVTNEDLVQALHSISAAEQTDILKRMILEESPAVVVAELRSRLRSQLPSDNASATAAPPAPASARALFAQARQMRADRDREAEKQRAALELRRLQGIERDEQKLWSRVDDLIAAKTIKAYAESVLVLKDLRDLSVYKEQKEVFVGRVEAILASHSKLPGLKRRIKDAALLA